MTIYAMGDLHGQAAMLRAAHDAISADKALYGADDATVVHLGDLCDRGPDSRGVIGFLADGIARGEPWVVLKGNHDRMFARFCANPDWHDPRLSRDLHWRHPRLGGLATLASYGVEGGIGRDRQVIHDELRAVMPDDHLAFLDACPLIHTTEDLIFVHAGIRPGVPLDRQREEDCIWIRDGFLDDSTDHGRLVVHGHTVVETPEHRGNRVNLDTGAGFGEALTVAVFEGRACFVLRDGERVALRP